MSVLGFVLIGCVTCINTEVGFGCTNTSAFGFGNWPTAINRLRVNYSSFSGRIAPFGETEYCTSHVYGLRSVTYTIASTGQDESLLRDLPYMTYRWYFHWMIELLSRRSQSDMILTCRRDPVETPTFCHIECDHAVDLRVDLGRRATKS